MAEISDETRAELEAAGIDVDRALLAVQQIESKDALAKALAARDRSRLALLEPTKRLRTAGATKRRKRTKAQKRARRRNR